MRLGRAESAFTIVELLVVVGIISLVIGISVPAVSNIIRSAEQTSTENSLLVASTVARDLAIREGIDTGVAFLRGAGEPMRLVVVAYAGEITEFEDTVDPFDGGAMIGGAELVTREVFAPVDGIDAIRLSGGFGIAGYVPAGGLNVTDVARADANAVWYDGVGFGEDITDEENLRYVGNWVLPEDGFFDINDAGGFFVNNGAITPRRSFMLRFRAGTGVLDRGSLPALVVDPRPVLREASSTEYEITPNVGSPGPGEIPINPSWWRVEEADSVHRWTRRVVSRTGEASWGTADPSEQIELRSRLIGLYSNDSVLCGPVSRIALYRDEQLALGIGAAGVNRETGTIYAPFDPMEGISFDVDGVLETRRVPGVTGARSSSDNAIRADINAWFGGDTDFDGELPFDPLDPTNPDTDDVPLARVYVIDAATGLLTEVP